MALIPGTTGNDRIQDTANPAVIYGGSGPDEIFGNGSADRIYGQSGADNIYGVAAGDLLWAEDSSIFDAGDNDVIISGASTWTILADTNGDTITDLTIFGLAGEIPNAGNIVL
ncbi:MAG: hypothetical protein H2040_09660 [Euryhalocaulis sp.]|uniref:hypothetical protein n=1 Tax=Euryhalocaulis sp. TaxID=2744307 RepID=UPI0017F348D2|nr:hypothetical protein [Euryhalocaulis sp.]MBA4802118.1 hypothetical protein [Euryhalocaulis sp.]